MDGLGVSGGISLFFGRLPQRKQMAVYFTEGNECTVVAYVSEQHRAEAERLWPQFRDSVMQASQGQGEAR